jgi:hypothetical protein
MWFWFGCMVYLGPEIRNGNQNAGVPGGAAARGTKEALWVDALTSKRPVKAMTLGRINVTVTVQAKLIVRLCDHNFVFLPVQVRDISS